MKYIEFMLVIYNFLFHLLMRIYEHIVIYKHKFSVAHN